MSDKAQGWLIILSVIAYLVIFFNFGITTTTVRQEERVQAKYYWRTNSLGSDLKVTYVEKRNVNGLGWTMISIPVLLLIGRYMKKTIDEANI